MIYVRRIERMYLLSIGQTLRPTKIVQQRHTLAHEILQIFCIEPRILCENSYAVLIFL